MITVDQLRDRLVQYQRPSGQERPLRRNDDFSPRSSLKTGALQGLKPAAVLVPIVNRPSPTLLLTRRVETLRAHAGQIAFPGGRIDETDISAHHAALREAHEEIGLSAHLVDVVGSLEDYETGTGYCVTPVVGIVQSNFSLQLHPAEVAEVFEVPLSFMLDPANHLTHAREWKGQVRTYYAIPYSDYYIWGATAGIIVNLCHAVKPLLFPDRQQGLK